MTQANQTDETDAVDPFVGTTIGHRYQIDSIVGRGGWSTVYAGHDLTIQRPVAIKILHHHLARDTETVKRFRREAEAAGCINNPHVVTIYDSGISASGQPYIVMELLKGQSLAQILDSEQRLSVKQAIDIFSQACDGLYAAHQKGVIHRDLKPSNILVVKRDHEGDLVEVVDFGLAKFSPQENKEDLTATGVSFGTPSYMSPEQCQGNELDARSDVYSLGCVMYRALTGQKAVDGDNIYLCMSKQVLETPKSFAEACPDLYIPPALERIIFKALEKDPDKRFANMDELRAALENYRRHVGTMPGLMHGGTISHVPPMLVVFVILGLAVVVTMYVMGIVNQAHEQLAKENAAKAPVPAGGSPLVQPPAQASRLRPSTADVSKPVAAGGSPLVQPPAQASRLRPSTADAAKPVAAGGSPLVQPPAQASRLRPPVPPSGEALLRKKPDVLRAEALLNPILEMVGLPVEPIPDADFVPDPDGYYNTVLANKVQFVQKMAPIWSNQTGQGMRLQQIGAQMAEVDKKAPSLPPVVQCELRMKIIDQALATMGMQPPAPDLRNVPPTFFIEGVQKRVAHKLTRIELAKQDWIRRGGDEPRLNAMMAQFKSAMDNAANN